MVVSYYGRISIGISSCQQIVPDPDVMAECFADSLDELELAVSQAVNRGDPAKLISDPQNKGVSLQDKKDPLKSFHDAFEALDKAIESLED